VRFMNALVHIYHIVEMEKVYDVIHNQLEDFEKFLGEIARFLKRGRG